MMQAALPRTSFIPPPTIGVTPHPDTSGNAGCGRSSTRSLYSRRPHSRSAPRARRAPPCGIARSRSSPKGNSITRIESHRGWSWDSKFSGE
jgi:hypothetical protein